MAGSVFHVRKNLSTLASSFDNEQQRVAVIYFRMTFARTVNITCTYDTQCSIIRLVESIGRQVKRAECSPTKLSIKQLTVCPALFMQEEATKEDMKSAEVTVPLINYRQLERNSRLTSRIKIYFCNFKCR